MQQQQQFDELRQAVHDAVGRVPVREAVARLYADVQARIDERRPVCAISGRCCRFEEYGHRLYVTTLELAGFVAGLTATETGETTPNPRGPWDGTGCPFQVAKLCSVHAIRPFGCRMFFCDATATDWQNQQYEQFHARLKQMHRDLGVRYFYVEWRQALRVLEIAHGAVPWNHPGI